MSHYKIIFSDKEMKVTMSTINKSVVLTEMVQKSTTGIIQLKFLTRDIFLKIMEMSKELNNIADMDKKMKYIKSEIDSLNDTSDIFDIIRGSHYLQMTNVLNIISAEFTDILKKLSPKSIRKRFGMTNDLNS